MCCQSKLHAVRALIAAVVLHVLCILLGVACCALTFVTITTPPQYCGRYCYPSEVTVPVSAAALPISSAAPALLLLAAAMLLSVLASVFICLRACRLRRSLQGGTSESKGCHTRAYTTLVLSILSTLCYIIGCSIIWGAAITLAKLAEEKLNAKLAVGPGYACASLVIIVSIATSVLEGVSHCCCKVKASPATSAQAAAAAPTMSAALASLEKVVAPAGYVIAFLPAPAAGHALPQALPLPPALPALAAASPAV